MRNPSTSISPSYTYVIVLDRLNQFEFRQITVPQNCDNNSSVAANLFHDRYLKEVSHTDAGLVIAVIAIEQIQESPVLRQIFLS
ncbi:hypothetical protein ACQ4M3_07585 [Leptolyngbya sp. AN03gr2]|uniref:hypothetical protein n=1 Tax=unclassified Leptolyngbya TaxID=2650499 RepID=UPI003D31FB2C